MAVTARRLREMRQQRRDKGPAGGAISLACSQPQSVLNLKRLVQLFGSQRATNRVKMGSNCGGAAQLAEGIGVEETVGQFYRLGANGSRRFSIILKFPWIAGYCLRLDADLPPH